MTGLSNTKDVEDEDSPWNISAHNHAASPNPPDMTETITSNTEQRKKVCTLMLA
jgi:hypothetical protein